jgi:hypothetical protein
VPISTDLAVAVNAASRRDEVRAQARERAERIMADAEAEIGRRDQRWRGRVAGRTGGRMDRGPTPNGTRSTWHRHTNPVDAVAGEKHAVTNAVEPTA